jgi:hypothetical protein
MDRPMTGRFRHELAFWLEFTFHLLILAMVAVILLASCAAPVPA